MRAPLHLSALSLLLCASTTVSAQGSTWHVAPAPGPGVDATSVNDALALASDGDLILVQPGSVEPFTVDGISVTIQGDPNGAVMPDFQDPAPPVAITVRNLAPGQSVTIRDFVVFQFGNTNPAALVTDNQGPVLFDDVFFDFLGGATVVEVRDSRSVAFNNSILQVQRLLGFDGQGFNSIGPDEAGGITALRSSVFLDNSSVQGPAGYESGVIINQTLPYPPSAGAPAVRLEGSSLTALSSALQAGQGGFAFEGCWNGGMGGDGLVLDEDQGVPSSARLVATSVAGGFGGASSGECGHVAGAPGTQFDLISGTLQAIQEPVHFLALQAKVAPNDTLGMTLVGEVDDLVFLIADTQLLPGFLLPGADVTLHVAPQIIVSLGQMVGQIETRSLPAPALPPSVDFLSFSTQALFVGAGTSRLTGPTGTVITN